MDICRCYAPAIACGTATVVCIVSNGVLTYKQQKALTGACMLARESLGRYQSKVKELYGPETHQHVIDELCKEDLDDVHVTSSGFFGSETLDFEGVSEDEPIHTFYDEFSNRYFDSTIEHVLQAEYHLNRNWALGMPLRSMTFMNFLVCALSRMATIWGGTGRWVFPGSTSIIELFIKTEKKFWSSRWCLRRTKWRCDIL